MCSLEFPGLDTELQQPFADQGLTVLGVSTGSFNESEATLDAFAEQTGVGFPLVHDSGTYSSWSFPPALSPFPRQVLIDRDGIVRYVASEHRAGELRAAVEEVLGVSR